MQMRFISQSMKFLPAETFVSYLACASWRCGSWVGDGQVSCTGTGQPCDWHAPQALCGEEHWPTEMKRDKELLLTQKRPKDNANQFCEGVEPYRTKNSKDTRLLMSRFSFSKGDEVWDLPPNWTRCLCNARWVQSRWVWIFSQPEWRVASSCSATVSEPVRSGPWSPRLEPEETSVFDFLIKSQKITLRHTVTTFNFPNSSTSMGSAHLYLYINTNADTAYKRYLKQLVWAVRSINATYLCSCQGVRTINWYSRGRVGGIEVFSQQSTVMDLQTLSLRIQLLPNYQHITIIQVVHHLHHTGPVGCV